MAKNITSSGAAVVASNASAILLQVNAALTGNIIVTVAGSTQYGTNSATIATITNPTVGSFYRYGGLTQQGAVSVNPSTACDITITILDQVQ